MQYRSPYSASFTAGSLLFRETSCMLPLFLSEQGEMLVREEVMNNNLLKINSEASRKRVVREINKRITSVNTDFWRLYAGKNVFEQKLLLFFVCLKTYKLMFDFHFNVTVKRWHSSCRQVEPYLYQMELHEIAAKDKYVDGWSDLTKNTLIGVYMRVLRETGLLEAKNCALKPAEASTEFWRYFVVNNESWFLDACLLSARQKVLFKMLNHKVHKGVSQSPQREIISFVTFVRSFCSLWLKKLFSVN